jgi:hypothetical protein
MATMLIEAAFSQREGARESRTAAEGALESAQRREIEEMRAQADARYAAAQVEGWSQVAAGTIGLVGTTVAVCATGDTATIGDGVSRTGPDLTKGIGGLLASGYALSADEHGAAAKEAEQVASHRKAETDDASEDARSARETVRKALDFLKEYEESVAQTQAAAIHRA